MVIYLLFVDKHMQHYKYFLKKIIYLCEHLIENDATFDYNLI